ncbi:uncharacterized protein LOC134834677 [Culicoides brevitarsis]|uniref:uncharacterized protein LOC134834677 n=1 Tax=Culicoides brevitarsis TaxID=469753 RepID=UPI00307C9D85
MEGGLSAFYCLYLFLLMEMSGIMGQNAKPSFKAEAPNILCSTSSALPTVFSINLVPATSDLKLKYHIKISYEYSMPTKTQHHSLSLWRTIRTLEQQLNAQRTMIDAQNKIDIATASLTPGVIYMFDIEAEGMDGTKSDVERFVLDYKDGTLYRMCRDEGTTIAPAAPTPMASENSSNMTTQSMAPVVTTLAPQVTSGMPTDVVNEINSSDANNENLTEEISTISLSGPSKIYAHVPLVVRAFPKFIGNINEYYIEWKVNDLPPEIRNILAIKGSLLTIPPYSLFPGKTYTIEANLMDASNSESVASANHSVTIERHELLVSMIPSNALIGVGRAIDIELKIQDYNLNGGRFKIQWRCVIIEESSEAESLCDRFNDVSEPKKSIVFTKAGLYHMEAIVVDELNLTAEAMSTIEVRNEIIARTQIDEMPKNPVDITKWVRGQASISYVVPKCVAKWSFVQKEGLPMKILPRFQALEKLS